MRPSFPGGQPQGQYGQPQQFGAPRAGAPQQFGQPQLQPQQPYGVGGFPQQQQQQQPYLGGGVLQGGGVRPPGGIMSAQQPMMQQPPRQPSTLIGGSGGFPQQQQMQPPFGQQQSQAPPFQQQQPQRGGVNPASFGGSQVPMMQTQQQPFIGGAAGVLNARPGFQQPQQQLPQQQFQQSTSNVAPNALPGSRAPATAFGGQQQQQQPFGTGAPRGAASVPSFGNNGVGVGGGAMPQVGAALGGGNQTLGARPPFTSSSVPPSAPFNSAPVNNQAVGPRGPILGAFPPGGSAGSLGPPIQQGPPMMNSGPPLSSVAPSSLPSTSSSSLSGPFGASKQIQGGPLFQQQQQQQQPPLAASASFGPPSGSGAPFSQTKATTGPPINQAPPFQQQQQQQQLQPTQQIASSMSSLTNGPFGGPLSAGAIQQQQQGGGLSNLSASASASSSSSSSSSSSNSMMMMPGRGMVMQSGPAALAPHMTSSSGGTVAMAQVDERLQCLSGYMSLTLGSIPLDKGMLEKTALPFGVLVQPMAEGEGSLGPRGVPVVNFGGSPATNGGASPSGGVVVRCKKCRAYVNPFVKFIDSGRHWKCNFCTFVNKVEDGYFSPTDADGNRADFHLRPELSQGSVEFIAPAEYMVRPPVPPVYIFVLDVSFHALQTGMLRVAVDAIRSSLDRLPGDSRTQVGFVTFDTSVHFYSLKPKLRAPQMLVVPDINELFLPVPDELLVNLHESRPLIDKLLTSLPDMFAGTRAMEICLGPALEAAFQICQHIGGKMIVCAACLPTIGGGKLHPRELPKSLGSDTEHMLLTPSTSDKDAVYYKEKAVEFSRQQISVDTFLFAQNYADVAAIGSLSRYTAGQVYHYPAFNQGLTQSTASAGNPQDRQRFSSDLLRNLTRTTGFEAVVRLRASKGINISNFYGNFFMRSNDLLALPNVTCDTAFVIELVHDPAEALQAGSTVCIQSALLYTSVEGERRILVHTLCKPVAAVVADLYTKIEVDNLITIMSRQSLDVALRTGLALARSHIHKSVVDIVRAWKAIQQAQSGNMYGMAATGLGGRMPGMLAPGNPPALPPTNDISNMLPDSLQLLPLFAMGLSKSILHRGGEHVRSDERSSLMFRMLSLPVRETRAFVYPRLFSLHDLDTLAGRPDNSQPPFTDPLTGLEHPKVTLPATGFRNDDGSIAPYPLSASILSSQGCYLLDDGVETYLWIGKEAPPGLVNALFGVQSLAGIETAALQLVDQGNNFSQRVCEVVKTLQSNSRAIGKLRIVVEGSGDVNEARFHWHMVEDRQGYKGGEVTYAEYCNSVFRESQMSGNLKSALT